MNINRETVTIDNDFQKCADIIFSQGNSDSNVQETLLRDSENIEIQTTSDKSTIRMTEECSPKTTSNTERKLKKREKFSQPCGAENVLFLRLLSSFMCLFVVWGILYSLLNKEVLPGGKLLTLIFLLASAYTAGDIFKLIELPKLSGMLLSGILIRNMGLYFDTKAPDAYSEVVYSTRQVALTSILITAGLELDAKALRKLRLVVLELSFIPCIIEAIGVAVCCKYLLNDFSWPWGMIVGFTMGAVSPAIVIPALLRLQKKGYDADNKISTIVIAAASFDDIVAISGFEIFFGMVFNEGNIMEKIIHGPLEVLAGLTVGGLWGILAAWIPHKMDKHVIAKRVFMIGGGGLFFVLGSSLLGYGGSGPLACIVSSFVACTCWKWQGWSPAYNPVRDVFASLWLLLQPALFGLIGAEIDLQLLKISEVVDACLVIGGGLVARSVACSAVLWTAEVTFKELLFINVSWIPKATVQAALGSLALDRAKSIHPIVAADVERGQIVLMIAVLSILITAPLGAIGINILGRVLLKRDKVSVISNDVI